ncbi:arginine N-succinyltransferase [Burkholderiaceae bacterium DAT-1]|nr:arginine N-succinyltransferase [Burkholderiaceae bacterium DAT-1]
MFLFRASRLSDLPQVEILARESPVGITSLPDDRDVLYRKIQTSVDSLGADVCFHGEESYFFVLEDLERGTLAGVSGLVASAGFNEPFYSYRNETLVHASAALNIHHKIHALSLCHDLTGNSLLTSYYVRPDLAYSAESDLLSRARFLFMANHPERFADHVVSEMVGVADEQGNSPFWDSVGRHFFGIDYHEAERMCGVHGRKFITELMPHHPVYVPLLTDEAQSAMGQVGPASEIPFDVLVREGFEAENYIDIFDGGPALHASVNHIRSFVQSRRLTAKAGNARAGARWLVANQSLDDFRAVVAEATLESGQLEMTAEVLDALGIASGDAVRAVPL